MRSRSFTSASLLAAALLVGCASAKVTHETPVVAQGLQKPNRIWVYDFIADPSKIPADSALSANLSPPSTPPTAEQLETGKKLGALIAQDLAADIRNMGLATVYVYPGAVPQPGDGVLRGYLVSVEGGSAAKRFVIGFGSGSSEMDTIVEGFAVTPQGWQRVGSGTLSASGNKMPGMVVPAALAIATGNPIGVIVMGGAKIYSEASGKNSIEARAKATADAIAKQLEIRFRERGWISSNS